MTREGGVNNMTYDERQRFTLRLPTKLFDCLGKKATETGVPLNALILQILWEWVKTNQNGN